MEFERLLRTNKISILDLHGQPFRPSADQVNREFRCLWQGGLLRPARRTKQPKAALLAQEIDGQGNTKTSYIGFSLNAADLALLRVDDVFSVNQKGQAQSHKRLIREELEFTLDFSEKGWSHYSLNSAEELLPPNIHSSYGPFKTYFEGAGFVRFFVSGNRSVLIPGMELFNATFGETSFVRAQILSHDFDVTMKKLFKRLDITETSSGQRPVYRSARCYKRDLDFLSALYYDDVCKKNVKRLIAERVINLDRRVHFPKIEPWFWNRGKMRLRGSWIKEKNVFFVTNITGIEYPKSPEIIDLSLLDRKGAEDEQQEEQEVGALHYQIEDAELDINSDLPPDSMAGVAAIVSGTMVHFYRAPVLKTESDEKKKRKKKYDQMIGTDVKEISSDEADGSGKDVGSFSSTSAEGARIIGTVGKLWRSLRQYQHAFPKKLVSVSCYTTLNGLSSEERLRIQAIWNQPYEPKDNWFKLPERGRLRGMMIAQLQRADKSMVYALSIERRLRMNKEPPEEADSFSLIYFTLTDDTSIGEITSYLIKTICKHKTRPSLKQLDDKTHFVDDAAHRPCKYFDENLGENIVFKTLIDKLIDGAPVDD